MGSILEMLKGRGQSADAGSQAGGKRQERKKTTKAKPKAKPTKRTEKSKATQQKAKYTPPKPKIKIKPKPKPPIEKPGSEWGKSGEKAWVAAGVKDFVANNRKWGTTGDRDRFGILNQFGEKSRLQPLQSLPKVFSSGRP